MTTAVFLKTEAVPISYIWKGNHGSIHQSGRRAARACRRALSGRGHRIWGDTGERPDEPWGNLGSGGSGFKAVFTGAIGDSGLSVSATAQGKPSKKENTGYRLFILKRGTIFFNTKQLDAAQNDNNTPPTTENNTTCSFTFVTTDPVTIISGTKAYAGISGSLNVTISFAAVLPLKNGKCNRT